MIRHVSITSRTGYEHQVPHQRRVEALAIMGSMVAVAALITMTVTLARLLTL